MSRSQPADFPASLILEQISACGEGAPTTDDKLLILRTIRGRSAEAAKEIDRLLIEELGRLRGGLFRAQAAQDELRAVIGKLTAPPCFPAVYLGKAEVRGMPGAMVQQGSERRVVALGDDIDGGSLEVGDEVLLSSERNIALAKSASLAPPSGETAAFSRRTADGRLVVKAREEELIVTPVGSLRALALKAGDELRIDRATWMAFEKIPRSNGNEYFLEETPEETFESIGGLNAEIKCLQQAIALHHFHPEIVQKYRLRRKNSVLLYGPPGTGKTLTARALANWMALLSRSGRSRFINVKPGALNSMWFGQTEFNYRDVFRVAREAGADEPDVPILMFFDEVDAIGGMRGDSVHHVDDRVLNAFMAELSGLEERGNIVVVTATNRLDALDSALVRPGRLGDLKLKIPRPGRKAAREIFGKHLQAAIPYAANGHDATAAREGLIDAAVSMIFSSNSESELANLVFRDGKRRPVRAGDLINGADIAAMAQSAAERACVREAQGGPAGLTPEDLLAAVADFFESSTRVLTPANCRKYLDGLPHDVEVASVDPVVRKVRNPHQYFNRAA